jgi:hypothetical protein
MILAIQGLSATAQAIVYGIAFGLFILAGLSGAGRWKGPSMLFVGLGLAAFVFPLFWNSLALS